MADIIPGIVIRCPSIESITRYNDTPQSGLIDEMTRAEFITYTN